MILWASVAVLGLRFLSAVPPMFQRVTCPVQVQQDEALHVDFALRLLDGKTPYPDFSSGGPYVHGLYPPLFYVLEAALLKAGAGLFQSGRWISLTAFLGILAFLALWGCGRWQGPWRWFGVLLVAASPTWDAWATVDRSDVLMAFFNLASLTVWMFRVEEPKDAAGPRGCWAFLAGLLHAAALLTKQTSLLLGAAVVFSCILRRRWKYLGAFALGAYGPAALATGVLVWGTHGMYWKHTVVYSQSLFDAHRLIRFLAGPWLMECGALAFLAAAARIAGKRPPIVVAVNAAFQTLFLTSFGRVGSAENYILEFTLAASLFFCEGWGRDAPFRAAWITAVPLALTSLLWAVQPVLRVPTADEIAMKRDAASRLEGKGPVLLQDPDLALMTGREVWYHPSSFGILYSMGVWDAASLVRELGQKRVEWVELYDGPEQDRIPPPVLDAIEASYEPAYRLYSRVWLKPKTKPPQKP
jgi:hypothetical protein